MDSLIERLHSYQLQAEEYRRECIDGMTYICRCVLEKNEPYVRPWMCIHARAHTNLVRLISVRTLKM